MSAGPGSSGGSGGPGSSGGPAPLGDDGEKAGVPSDNTTLLTVLRAYEDAGFTEQLVVIEDGDGSVRCGHCGALSPPDQIVVRSLRRMEGASDPADMLAVIAAECPACGAKGTIIVHYGPEASEAESALLLHAQDDRGSGNLPYGKAPDEQRTGEQSSVPGPKGAS